MVCPPSTTKHDPVINEAFSELKNKTKLATSSAEPNLFKGTFSFWKTVLPYMLHVFGMFIMTLSINKNLDCFWSFLSIPITGVTQAIPSFVSLYIVAIEFPKHGVGTGAGLVVFAYNFSYLAYTVCTYYYDKMTTYWMGLGSGIVGFLVFIHLYRKVLHKLRL